MKWKKIDRDNLPEYEVLVTDGTDYLVGYLSYFDDSYVQYIICEDDNTVLPNPTHYIDPNEIEFEEE